MENAIILINNTTSQDAVSSMNSTSGSVRSTIISDAVGAVIGFVNFGVASGIIAFTGICTNTANIATFIKLGFKDTINISLTALAMADMASLFCLLAVSVCYTRVLCGLFCHVVDFEEIAYMVGGVPRSYFVAMASYVTSMVALERCLCVLMPLKVKSIFTREKIIGVLVTIFVVASILYLPLFYTTRIGWTFNPETNRTWVSLIYMESGFEVNGYAFKVIAFLLVLTYVVVTLSTITIVYKLSAQSSWRTARAQTKATSSGGDQHSEAKKDKAGLTGKDRRATRTVVLIATMYIICFFPGTVFMLTMSIVPGFNKGMFYKNMLEACWSSAYVFEGFCSCANIVIYLNTSTRFKEAFLDFFKSGTGKGRMKIK